MYRWEKTVVYQLRRAGHNRQFYPRLLATSWSPPELLRKIKLEGHLTNLGDSWENRHSPRYFSPGTPSSIHGIFLPKPRLTWTSLENHTFRFPGTDHKFRQPLCPSLWFEEYFSRGSIKSKTKFHQGVAWESEAPVKRLSTWPKQNLNARARHRPPPDKYDQSINNRVGLGS